MTTAGISGIGVISALGRNAEETRSALFSGEHVLPVPPTHFKTKLSLPVFELPEPEFPKQAGVSLRLLLIALEEALADARLTPEEREALEREIPAGRFGTPEETAELVSLLLRAPLYLTGQIICLDGGWF